MLKPGDDAPAFILPNSQHEPVRLADFRGKPLVIYFYARDNTPGCTREAQGFRDLYPQFVAAGAELVGISPDKVTAHHRFRQKHELPFELLSDEERAVARLYGVLGEKKMYGKVSLGMVRTTFVIDARGKIVHVLGGIKAHEHPEAALRALVG